MKILAIASFALLVGAVASQAMVPGLPEIGRHIRSLPVIDNGQFKGDLVIPMPKNGPMLAPVMPWRPPSSAVC